MSTLNDALIRTALKEYGVAAIAGPRHNSRVQEFLRTVGFGRTDEVAWCAAFMRWLFLEVTGKGVGKGNARSWETLEEPFQVKNIGNLDKALPGDVVVLWRGSRRSWKGHVALFVRRTQNHVYLLGGNQGGKVSIKRYPKSRVLAVRRFRDSEPVRSPSPQPDDME